MADIPLLDYDVPFFNRTDLGLGLAAMFVFIVVNQVFSTFRSPFDLGILLEGFVSSIGFLNEWIGVSLRLPFSQALVMYFIFALTLVLTLFLYDVSFGKGLRKSNRYFLVFVAGFVFGVPYGLFAWVANFFGGLFQLIGFVVLYFYYVASMKLVRIVANR